MPHDPAIAAKGQEMEQARWELPEKYRITEAALALPREELRKKHPEMYAIITKSEAKQKEWAQKANQAYGQMSPQEAERARSVTIAESHRTAIENLNKQLARAVITGDGDIDALQAAIRALRHKLAERYSIMGRLDLSVAVEPDQQYRDHYLAILEAVWRDDDEQCSCEPLRGSGEHSAVEVHQSFVKEEVWSLKHGQMVFLIKCNGCGLMNAIPQLPKHLREQRAHRAKAMRLAGHLSPEAAAAELTRRGHTAAKLLK